MVLCKSPKKGLHCEKTKKEAAQSCRAGLFLILWGLSDGPGLTAPQQLIQIALSFAGDNLFDLHVQHLFITRSVVLIKNAKWAGQMSFYARIVEHPHQDLGLEEIVLVVYPAIAFAEILAKLDDNGSEAVESDAFLALRTKDKGFALLEEQGLQGLRTFFCVDLEGAVVEDITVLIDLEEGSALMGVTPDQHLLQVFGIPVHAPRDEAGIGPPGKREGIERMVKAAERRRLGNLSFFRSGRVLPLCQAVDLIIEKQDVNVEVPAQQMDRMITPDTQAVAITRDYPDAEFRPRRLQSRRDGGRPAMDRMHTIGIHIIWEPAATADTGNDHDVFAGYPKGRHDLLYLREYRIIPATGAPTHFLVGGKILRRQCRRDRCCFTHDKLFPVITTNLSFCTISGLCSVEIPPQ
jgi:hypothetical protein